MCIYRHIYAQASQVAQMVNNLLENTGDSRELVQSLGQEDLLDKGRATYSSILA